MTLTSDDRDLLISEIFSRFQYGSGIRLLKATVPEASEMDICEYVEEAFDELINWNHKGENYE